MVAPRQPLITDVSDLGLWSAWVPNPVAQNVGGTPATFAVNRARFCKIKNKTTFIIDLSIVNQGIGNTGAIKFDPPTPVAFFGIGLSWEYATVGAMGICYISVGAQKINAARLDPATGFASLNYFTTGWAIIAQGEYENT